MFFDEDQIKINVSKRMRYMLKTKPIHEIDIIKLTIEETKLFYGLTLMEVGSKW